MLNSLLHKGEEKYPEMALNYYDPVLSNREGKKLMVRVYNPYTQSDKIIHFGDVDYEDYRQHNDERRRENYLTRSAGIRDKYGLTKDNPLSANYWSRRILWDSAEPYYLYLPAGSSSKDFSHLGNVVPLQK
jgi:hypothetical protein